MLGVVFKKKKSLFYHSSPKSYQWLKDFVWDFHQCQKESGYERTEPEYGCSHEAGGKSGRISAA